MLGIKKLKEQKRPDQLTQIFYKIQLHLKINGVRPQ